MSDPKRGTLITVDTPKSANNNVTKTVRLTINLDESNERKYPELNYKKLVIAEEKKKKLSNGKPSGLDPFSDNDDDVERVAKKFEQKYGGKSTYGKKGKSKHEEFADIGAGYDENDSFIDNTDGYDEMIQPGTDTLYGGFYINSGLLEFKNVPENQLSQSDSDNNAGRRNKRRISSSSSSEVSSGSSSDTLEEKSKDQPAENGTDLHGSEHRKKKKKNIEKQKAKRIKRADSSAAASGKQTSDENAPEIESADSRTSQSDSLTSKPAPSSENAVTSDSSREAAGESLPPPVQRAVLELRRADRGDVATDMLLVRLDRVLLEYDANIHKQAWTTVAMILNTDVNSLKNRVKALSNSGPTANSNIGTANSIIAPPIQPSPASAPKASAVNHQSVKPPPKRRKQDTDLSDEEIAAMTQHDRDRKVEEFLKRLKALIEDKKPAMISNYNAECDKVQEERRKLQQSAPLGAPVVERRLPKRRFPWCARTRALLQALTRLSGRDDLLARHVLPLFPKGFVRMPTLLRQALVKPDMKRQQSKPVQNSQPTPITQPQTQPFTETIQFPSSLTVTATVKQTEKQENNIDKPKPNNVANKPFESQYNNIATALSMVSKDLLVEKSDRKHKESENSKEDKYPPNSIGSITITPVVAEKIKEQTNLQEKKKESLIRVKSPAALTREADEMAKKDRMNKLNKIEKNHSQNKEKRVNSPLLIDTTFQTKDKANPSPNNKKDEIKIKNHTIEDNIPRPALIPVQHSPTIFAKPDKMLTEPKKKRDVVIMSDVDPLLDNSEALAIDDSSSDVEIIDDKSDAKSFPKNKGVTKNFSEVNKNSEKVPSKDKSGSVTNSVKDSDRNRSKVPERSDPMDVDEDSVSNMSALLRNLKEMQDSQEPKFSSSFSGVTSAKNCDPAVVKDRCTNKLAERLSLNNTDGCNESEMDFK